MSTAKQRAQLRDAIAAALEADNVSWDDVATALVAVAAERMPQFVDRFPGAWSRRFAGTVRHAEDRHHYWRKQDAAPRSAACAHCGGLFPITRSDARYCSARCRVAAKRLRDRSAA